LDDAPLERIADALRRAPLAGPGRHGWAPRAADCDPRSGAVKSLPRAPSDAREGVAERAVPTRACAGTTLLPRWRVWNTHPSLHPPCRHGGGSGKSRWESDYYGGTSPGHLSARGLRCEPDDHEVMCGTRGGPEQPGAESVEPGVGVPPASREPVRALKYKGT